MNLSLKETKKAGHCCHIMIMKPAYNQFKQKKPPKGDLVTLIP